MTAGADGDWGDGFEFWLLQHQRMPLSLQGHGRAWSRGRKHAAAHGFFVDY